MASEVDEIAIMRPYVGHAPGLESSRRLSTRMQGLRHEAVYMCAERIRGNDFLLGSQPFIPMRHTLAHPLYLN